MLNLSNEVVKMRSEVKKVKVFIIRKLTRQMNMLKKKKGKEEDMQRNQRRAARLLEEIREMKVLAPDTVTKSALQADINFEKVCQNPQASITDRAVARIATHPQFSQKIQSIKDRIKAFKDERTGTSSKGEKKSKPAITEKETERPVASEDVQTTAGEVEKILTEKPDGNDNPPSERGVTVTDETTAPQTMSDNEAATVKQTSSTESEKVPVEVVRMRKEVKKIRVLIISKLTNQTEVLKRKKGEPSAMEENQQKISRLLKEIQVLRSVKPDHVTQAALQENANLEKVCEDPDASPLERSTARIVTHPRFVKRLQAVKDAIEEEERKAALAEEKRKRRLEQASVQGEDSVNEEDDEDQDDEVDDDDDDDNNEDDDDEEDDGDEETEEDDETGDSEAEDEDEEEEMLNERHITSESQVAEEAQKVADEDVTIKSTSASVKKPLTVEAKPEGHSVTVVDQESTSNISSIVDTSFKPDANTTPLKKSPTVSPAPKNKPISKSVCKTPVNKNKKEVKVTEDVDSESDLELSDGEEKPYFDDSTEERFHKQSSMSESDDDDFFIGKVSKFKKKKKNPTAGEEKTKDERKSADHDTEQDQKQEENETTIKSDFKHSKFESVFCNALSKGRGGRDRFGAKPPPRFQKPMRQPEGDSKAPWERKQNQNSAPNRKPGSSFQNQKSDFSSNWGHKDKGSFGAGRGRQPNDSWQSQGRSQRPPPGKTFNSSRQAPEALHPSWEASKRRKEQMSQITAFQGKKIKFDDD